MGDRLPQERTPKQVTQTASTVPTPGLVGPWSPVPSDVEEALNQLILVPQPVLLGQLGPDIIGGGFGSANWVNGALSARILLGSDQLWEARSCVVDTLPRRTR